MSKEIIRPWWDRTGIQGLILFIVMLILMSVEMIRFNKQPDMYLTFTAGFSLAIFLLGEK